MEAVISKSMPVLEAWLEIVANLEHDITAWCESEQWTVTVSETRVIDARPQYGLYDIPSLSIETHTFENHLVVEPMAHAFDGTGMVRVYAWPTLYSVRLLYRGSPTNWEILTDSRIPLHEEWNKATFMRLAQDLLKADY